MHGGEGVPRRGWWSTARSECGGVWCGGPSVSDAAQVRSGTNSPRRERELARQFRSCGRDTCCCGSELRRLSLLWFWAVGGACATGVSGGFLGDTLSVNQIGLEYNVQINFRTSTACTHVHTV